MICLRAQNQSRLSSEERRNQSADQNQKVLPEVYTFLAFRAFIPTLLDIGGMPWLWVKVATFGYQPPNPFWKHSVHLSVQSQPRKPCWSSGCSKASLPWCSAAVEEAKEDLTSRQNLLARQTSRNLKDLGYSLLGRMLAQYGSDL